MAALTAGMTRSGATADLGPGGAPAARTTGPAGADRSTAVSSGTRTVRSWPLLVLAAPPAAEVWSGWVGIAQKRLAAIRAAHPEAETYDDHPGRILVPDITDHDDIMITTEVFASALGVVRLPGATTADCWPPFFLSVKSAPGVVAGEGHLRRGGAGRATTP
jgi:hypothetical protein